ncbi:Crp/Fnr family transcriptional regulator [Pedobacter frigidisoli]|uniref:Crp/Fnr family transcriptional regulator n=1 Tax=Pedobacter frigidisoli TaxID=2530455 RepID=A0A4R0P5J8_9SPHI|nr:Crp/Fnr family transcriptional regulator [Pedobacter frigidisoli]TCD07703.1 Crp/Fnr family transcriptional regulator [Pedobacter frigidisoli]
MRLNSQNTRYILPLFSYLESLHPLPAAFIRHYEQNCQLITVRKNKFIRSPIDLNNSMYFLLKGVVRGFIRLGREEITTCFTFENQFLEAVAHPDKPNESSTEILQALEECQLIRIPYSLTDFLCERFQEANIIERKLLSIHHRAAAQRSILARTPTALGRYLQLQNSDFDLSRVAQKYLASYLCMRLETLSRMRSKQVHARVLKLA